MMRATTRYQVAGRCKSKLSSPAMADYWDTDSATYHAVEPGTHRTLCGHHVPDSPPVESPWFWGHSDERTVTCKRCQNKLER